MRAEDMVVLVEVVVAVCRTLVGNPGGGNNSDVQSRGAVFKCSRLSPPVRFEIDYGIRPPEVAVFPVYRTDPKFELALVTPVRNAYSINIVRSVRFLVVQGT